MRYLELKRWSGGLGLNFNPNRMSINHLSAQNTGDGNQRCCQQREIQAPRIKATFVIKAQEPVERAQRQCHDGQQRMTPGDDEAANAGDENQITQACKASQPTTQAANSRQPQTGACPERVVRVKIGQVGAHQSEQEGYGKMDQHWVNRVSCNRNTADNRFLCHGRLLWKLKMKRLTVLHSFASSASIVTLFFLGGCSGPQSALNPAGPSALAIANLWWGMFGFFALVLVIVVALWLYAMWRKPVSLTETQANRLHQRWIIGGGLILPLMTIIVLLSFSIPMGYRMLPLPLDGQAPLRIDITAHQWRWEVYYSDADIKTKNELHLPAGVPVDIHVRSADVIHSFWVPRLAGKIDVIPGRTNILRLEADAPGRFRGQCAEFCGKWHALMVLMVEAHTPEDFEAWLEEHKHD